MGHVREELWRAVFPQNLSCWSRVLSPSLCGPTSLNQSFPEALGLMCLCPNGHGFTWWYLRLSCILCAGPKLVFSKFHGIIDSLRLEKTTKIIESNCQPIATVPLSHVPQCHIYPFLENLQNFLEAQPLNATGQQSHRKPPGMQVSSAELWEGSHLSKSFQSQHCSQSTFLNKAIVQP